MRTHKQNVLRRLGLPEDSELNIEVISELTGLPADILQEVYNRGVGAWKTNISSVRLKKDFSKNPDLKRFPRSARLTREQWGMARVYSFLDGGTTWLTADRDLALEVMHKLR
jgi:hypothetical protein